MSKAMELFPLPQVRKTQQQVIEEVEKAYAAGARFVILEAPVGSGKSAIGITFARLFGSSHIITPRKSLQNQYFYDFQDDLVLMKGRKAYPCTRHTEEAYYKKVIKLIETGRIKEPSREETPCSEGPCIGDSDIYWDCVTDGAPLDKAGINAIKDDVVRPCPYRVAIEVAQHSKHIVHNIHSFVFQTGFYVQHFERRELMIIDEAHEIENNVRTFISKKISLPTILSDEHKPKGFKTVTDWTDWFKTQASMFADRMEAGTFESPRKAFLTQVSNLASYAETYGEDFVVDAQEDLRNRRTKYVFIPARIGNAAHNLLFDYGKKVLLMSGTIYSKDIFCRNLGIRSDEVYFLRVGSSFPKASRPIYLKPDYMVDTSHAKWNENYPKLVEIIKKILLVYPDVKGLIHAPSYNVGHNLALSLKDRRIKTHDPHDFLDKLDKFFKAPGNGVFISPVCQQGVDFKDDRARFQIVIRVPYLNTGDPFIEHKVKTDFPWYNYQSLITLGQQIGRINRSEQDFGATILVDERFAKFLKKNSSVIPNWIKESIIT